MEFKLKNFSINHSHSSMKVGTDAILLACLTPELEFAKILDIGTGSGIIALCMAERYKKSKIMAIDIDKDSIEEAESNFLLSPYNDRLKANHIDVQTFSSLERDSFDFIVTNPPYFLNSLESPSQKRTKARHTSNLSYYDLIYSANKILKPKGYFSLILPYNESNVFLNIASEFSLTLQERVLIYSKSNSPCKRVILNFQKESDMNLFQERKIILRNNDNTYTEDYFFLVRRFLI